MAGLPQVRSAIGRKSVGGGHRETYLSQFTGERHCAPRLQSPEVELAVRRQRSGQRGAALGMLEPGESPARAAVGRDGSFSGAACLPEGRSPEASERSPSRAVLAGLTPRRMESLGRRPGWEDAGEGRKDVSPPAVRAGGERSGSSGRRRVQVGVAEGRPLRVWYSASKYELGARRDYF